MQKGTYKKRLDRIKENKAKFLILKFMYKLLPLLIVIIYPVMVAIKGFMGLDLDFILMIAVPAGVLILITAMRKIIKRERPYERFDTPPLFERDGEGDSFPSRHTASAFIIAMSGFVLSPFLGVGLLLVAAAIGVSRILSGVHYVTDVLAGMLISVIFGTIAFIII